MSFKVEDIDTKQSYRHQEIIDLFNSDPQSIVGFVTQEKHLENKEIRDIDIMAFEAWREWFIKRGIPFVVTVKGHSRKLWKEDVVYAAGE